MKKVLISVFMFFCMTQMTYADINKENAVNMIKSLTSEGIEQIINSNSTQAEKQKVFRKLFIENLDLDFIGKYVLGRYWKTATPAQKKEFITLYKEFNVKTWSERFDEFKGKNFVMNGTSPANNNSQIFVNTTVPVKDGAPISVKWRVYDKDGKLKVVDIIIENVSLAQTARNEYASFISKSPKGIEGLLENLRTKVK